MKRLLLFIGLLIGTLLFVSENETAGNDQAAPQGQETVMKEKNPVSDIHYQIEALGNELKESNCLTPRRVFHSRSVSSKASTSCCNRCASVAWGRSSKLRKTCRSANPFIYPHFSAVQGIMSSP